MNASTSDLEVRILKRGDKSRQRPPEFADVFCGLGQVVGEVDFRIAQSANLVNGDLEAVLVLVE